MHHPVRPNWWVLALQGVALIVFGIFAIFVPSIALISLVLVFAVVALVDGGLALLALFQRHPYAPRLVLLLHGVLGIAAGVVALVWPAITTVALLFLIGLWAVVIGVLRVIGGIRLRKIVRDEWLLIVSGILSVIFGIIFLALPGVGVFALLTVVGFYAIAYGILLIGLSIRFRRLRGSVEPTEG
jgi:uncharacterized membrane protein HdeD (DUF308 family)